MTREQENIRQLQDRMMVLLLVNLLIAAVVPTFFAPFGNSWDYILAFVAGYLVLTLADRRYGRYLWYSTIFVLYLIWEIILSNIEIAWLVLQPKPKLDPGIIAVPLTISSGLEITALASAITLTPGTISVDLGENDQGQRMLYVHALVVGDPEKFRSSIKGGFEHLILRISRGVQ